MSYHQILTEMHALLDALAAQPCQRSVGGECGACRTCLARRALRALEEGLSRPRW